MVCCYSLDWDWTYGELIMTIVCDRPKTFMSWAQVTVLHIWMLIVRIRAFEPNRVKTWQQHFVDHFFYDAEGKMIHTYKVYFQPDPSERDLLIGLAG